MSYTPPIGSAADATWHGAPPHTPPAGSTADVTWRTGVTGSAVVTLSPGVTAPGRHGVAGSAAIGIPLAASGTGSQTSLTPGVTGAGLAGIPLATSAHGAHGVAGHAAPGIALAATAQGAHGVAGAVAIGIPCAVVGQGAHGVAGRVTARLGLAAQATGIHPRYEVVGEVRDGGILVNRRVRLYHRDTGALLAQGDTNAGRFRLHAGWAAIETTVIPIHLDPAAVDTAPPCANRVLAVLAQDA